MGCGPPGRRGGPGRSAVPPRGRDPRVVDTHAHLESCEVPVPQLLRAAADAGVERVVTIGVGRESSVRAVALAEEHPMVWAAVGVHPHDADGWTDADAHWVAELAAHPRVVAVGECGLDHFRNHSTPEAQMRAFTAQIALARAAGLPLVIHTREATEETLDVLERQADGVVVILHCFSITEAAHVDRVIDAGWFTSFAGPITYPKNEELRAAAARIPADRLLVETDSPYLAPVPRRGRPNEPANVAHTLAALAAVRGMAVGECDALTTANAARAFGW
ncbi:MAG: TatD family hydrolase [Thermoleophilia bacterium]